jgi:hypothetical protein
MTETEKKKTFRSIDEVWAHFFPEASREEAGDNAPAKYGARLGLKAAELLRSELKRSDLQNS